LNLKKPLHKKEGYMDLLDYIAMGIAIIFILTMAFIPKFRKKVFHFFNLNRGTNVK